jgi:hypothetical protein
MRASEGNPYKPDWLKRLLTMRSALLAILLTLAVVSSHAQAPIHQQIAHEDVFTGFKFPQLLGAFRFQNRVQYAHVDLGYGLNYVETTGATATIVVYDLNRRAIANGTLDANVIEEFGKLEDAIATMARQTGYQGVTRIEVPQLSKGWLQVAHELARPDGRKAFSYSFLRGQQGKFVKIRITTSSQGTFARLPIFLLGVSRAIGMLSENAPP